MPAAAPSPVAWKVTALASRAAVESALIAHEEGAAGESDIAVAGSEMAEDRPDAWLFEAWLPRQPQDRDLAALRDLFAGAAPPFTIAPVPPADWVAQSQAGLAPIVAGRFRVRTPDHPPELSAGLVEIVIPASQAFGTGQHATTAGCLEMLSAIAARGSAVSSFADIGTGTGLLAFAARILWPHARGIASDIDPVCESVLGENAALNAVPLGTGSGELAFVVAAGLDHLALRARAPFDLIVANILAGPLIELAVGFAAALAPGGSLVLAGLLTSQDNAVRTACERAGLVFAGRLIRGDWAILELRRPAR